MVAELLTASDESRALDRTRIDRCVHTASCSVGCDGRSPARPLYIPRFPTICILERGTNTIGTRFLFCSVEHRTNTARQGCVLEQRTNTNGTSLCSGTQNVTLVLILRGCREGRGGWFDIFSLTFLGGHVVPRVLAVLNACTCVGVCGATRAERVVLC